MLSGDVSLSQSRGDTASPVPPQITGDLKARVLLQPQPLTPPADKGHYSLQIILLYQFQMYGHQDILTFVLL